LMNTQGLLDRLLGAGKSLLDETGVTTQQGTVTDFGKGAAIGGLAGLLLGGKTGRKLATYGGLAALGTMAWRAYTQGKSQDGPPWAEGDRSTGESSAVLRAVLAAARVDGHIDERERKLIDREIVRHGGDSALRAWVEKELSAPLDPQAIADEVAGDPRMASEVYLASSLVIGKADFLERAYLDHLAEHLGLDKDLQRRLEETALGAQRVDVAFQSTLSVDGG
jgi:uncharacterized membrane protein YebE (DUF533 family)